nr:MAG: RimK family alpha-L-glutamate ligase [Pseudomonadota bacterium]
MRTVTRPTTLVVLARTRRGTTQRLLRAARARGLSPRFLDPAACTAYVDGQRSRLLHRGKRVGEVELVVPRLRTVSSHALAVLHHLETAGAHVLNSAEAISRASHPMHALQLLAHHGIDVSRTVVGRDARGVRRLIEWVGGLPVRLGVLRGGERRATVICETPHSLEAALEVLFRLGQDILVQRYLHAPSERDVRVLVVGGHVVCGVRRIPQPGRLARAIEPGTRYESIPLSSKLVEVAEATARLLGLGVVAVDMLDRDDHPRVFEVDAAPALLALEKATGRDLAGTIVEAAVSEGSRWAVSAPC